MQPTQNKGMGYWLAVIGSILLAVSMVVYLGKHSLDFFLTTFKGEDQIFAYLGLMTTSIGAIIWLLKLKFMCNTYLDKAIALIMLAVSLTGEFVVAGFNMYMNAGGALLNMQWTTEDLRTMTYVIAGLAFLNGLALVAELVGEQIIHDMPGKSESIAVPQDSVFIAKAAETERAELPSPFQPE